MERLNEMNEEKAAKIVAVVIHQPHRKFARVPNLPWRENAVGRFCDDYGLNEEVYNAAHAYNDIRRRWRAAKGAPTDLRLSEGHGMSDGPSAATVDGWARRLALVRLGVVSSAGAEAWLSAELLIVDNIDLPERYHACARDGLEALAVEMGMPKERRAFA